MRNERQTGCHKKGKFSETDSGYLAFYILLISQKMFHWNDTKWQMKNLEYKYYTDYFKFISKVSPCAFYVTRVVFDH